MPNNFEKQVKEKMDELTFVPTAPVWEEIQKQIRAKKDRRRFLFWLPLLILITGTGTWLLRIGQANKVEHKTVDVQMHQRNAVEDALVTGKENIQMKEQTALPFQYEHQGIFINNESKKHGDKKTPFNNHRKETASVYNNDKGDLIKNNFQDNYNLSKEQGNVPMDRKSEQMLTVSYLPGHLLNQPVFLFLGDSVKAIKVVADTSFIDSSLVRSKEIKSHWQTGITAGAGFSGMSKSFDVFPASLQADAGSISGNFNSYRYLSSPVNKSRALSIGVEAKKQLSPRISFALGIAYRYFSTSIKIGQEKLQDTILGSNTSVNRFYLGYGANLHDYSNQYHFISIPLSMSWKVGSNIPVYLEGNISVNQLIHTNALVFDGRSGIYYTDKSVYNKTQLMTGLGVYYGLLRSSLLIGPQVQYGLQRMEKNGYSNHLVYAGLQAHYFFKK